MYRTFKVTDTDGKKTKWTVYPEEDNRVEISGDDIGLNLDDMREFDRMICAVTQFLDGNTRCKIEVEEEE